MVATAGGARGGGSLCNVGTAPRYRALMLPVSPRSVLRLLAGGAQTDRELAGRLGNRLTAEDVQSATGALEYVDQIRRIAGRWELTDEGRTVLGVASAAD
jgi:hypothetical protein